MMKPRWDEYFLLMVEIVRLRSDCLGRRVGAVIVDDKHRIIATGYNGTPAGTPNCTDGGCPRCLRRKNNEIKSGEDLDSCKCVHAEANAIMHGTSIDGTTMYTTALPCLQCAKLIVSSGIKRVIIHDTFVMSPETKTLFQDAGVEVIGSTGDYIETFRAALSPWIRERIGTVLSD